MLGSVLNISASMLLGWLGEFAAWFLVWLPAVALLEYATHRWIMHWANPLLDPDLSQLKSHGRHHQGDNGPDLVDVPLRNPLRLTAPLFLVVLACGLIWGQPSSVVLPAAALFIWTVLYVYLWNCMHRAIHDVEPNWFRRCGPIFHFYRRHHLVHHVYPRTNFGTVFPFTDYLFFTWARFGRRRRIAYAGEHAS